MDFQESRERKNVRRVGAALLSLFAVLAVFLGGLQFYNNLYTPIAQYQAETKTVAADIDIESFRLEHVDTDHDGLFDLTEIQDYQTSPYLADTDSDGTDDGVEITRGTDPNCAEGKDCVASDITLAPPSATSTNLSPLARPTLIDAIGSTPITTGEQSDSQADLIASLLSDPAALRKSLLDSKQMTQAQLDAISDETLLNYARQVVAASTTTQTSSP